MKVRTDTPFISEQRCSSLTFCSQADRYLWENDHFSHHRVVSLFLHPWVICASGDRVYLCTRSAWRLGSPSSTVPIRFQTWPGERIVTPSPRFSPAPSRRSTSENLSKGALRVGISQHTCRGAVRRLRLSPWLAQLLTLSGGKFVSPSLDKKQREACPDWRLTCDRAFLTDPRVKEAAMLFGRSRDPIWKRW